MLKKRIIPCLDVRDGRVVKGVKFANHRDMGDPIELAKTYAEMGADELVFYDITASADGRSLDKQWIADIARVIDIPFAVAGGIKTVKDAEHSLAMGADKISINSPAINNPDLIDEMVRAFGTQCIVIGIDSLESEGAYHIAKNTGRPEKMEILSKTTGDWAREVIDRGAGEIVLNCMNQDGVRKGYDIKQLSALRDDISVPLIASGGAGEMVHFKDVFNAARVDGALAASVFHMGVFTVPALKTWLNAEGIEVRQ